MTDNRKDLVAKDFKSKPPQERLNAETIRHFMHDFVTYEFARNFFDASAALNALYVRFEERRGFRGNLSKSGIETAIQDLRPITFAQIDAIARYYKIPVSVLLIFTRSRDEMESVEQRKRGDVRRVLSAMRAALDHLERLTDDVLRSEDDLYKIMGYETFKAYAEAYRAAYDDIFL